MKTTKNLEDGSQITSNIYPCLLGTDSQNEVLNVLSDKKQKQAIRLQKKKKKGRPDPYPAVRTQEWDFKEFKELRQPTV